MHDWHVLVDRGNYRNTRALPLEPRTLSDGEVRLRVDSFGLTANNVTYAAAGDMIGYWTFFPAPATDDGIEWGRTPVWGFADVVESRHMGVAEGERLYGYLPMSTELIIEPGRVNDHVVTDREASNLVARCHDRPNGFGVSLEYTDIDLGVSTTALGLRWKF